MIDIVIPLRNDSHWQNNEIRYCLRSVEMYLKDIRNVYIVGYKPKFIHNVIHIPINDPHPWVTFNIRSKLLMACENSNVSNMFIYMNDDHYLLPAFNKFAYYHGCQIGDLDSKNAVYRQIIKNTINKTSKYWANYDVHTPIPIIKNLFSESMNQWDWEDDKNKWNPEWGGYLIKSVYTHYLSKSGNLHKLFHNNMFVEDGKIRNQKWTYADLLTFMSDKPVISSSDFVGRALTAQLQAMFPNKSKYEV